MIETVEGIILNEKSYSETSKILNIITAKYGIIGVMAKGAKRINSPFRSGTMKLTFAKFHIVYKKDKLSTLTGVDVINPLRQITKDIDRISYASFLTELSQQVMKTSGEKRVYELLREGLLKIEEGFDPMVITNIIELKYLDFLGVMPIIDSCASCGNKNEIVTLSSSAGGYLCKKCIKHNEHVVDPKVIKLLRMFYYVDVAKIESTNIKDKYKFQINTFLDEYYDRYTGLYLKSKEFIKNLNKIIKE